MIDSNGCYDNFGPWILILNDQLDVFIRNGTERNGTE
jgi:hypothetical protein